MGGTASLALDLNFLLRTPLWAPTPRDSRLVGGRQAEAVLVLDDHELAAGKLAALMARTASRDLFDAHGLLARGGLDASKLRLGFVVYGGISRKDWRTIAIDDIAPSPKDVERDLVPMLRADVAPAKADIPAWTENLVSECRALMASVLPLADHERAFLDQLNDHGEIRSELLTDDPMLRQIIASHPGLKWKALNVRQHRGISK